MTISTICHVEEPRESALKAGISGHKLSIVVPVYNGGSSFSSCLDSITSSKFRDWELIVVDDGSTDGSALTAERAGAKVVRLAKRHGPAQARNVGAALAGGDYLCFIDADCEVHDDTLLRIVDKFELYPHIGALFGSYDEAPAAQNFIAQYKNLLHRYVHQESSENASTFWTGCGAIRRELFILLGGFDADRFYRSTLEDVELGYRVKEAGEQILLAKDVLVKHHKAWTFFALLKSDIFDRGVPWTRLMMEKDRRLVDELNLQARARVSVALSWCLLGSSAALASQLLRQTLYREPADPCWRYGLLSVCAAAALCLLVLNQNLYRRFVHDRSLWFTVRAIAMHWLYYTYCGISFVLGLVLHITHRISSRATLVGLWLLDARQSSAPKV